MLFFAVWALLFVAVAVHARQLAPIAVDSAGRNVYELPARAPPLTPFRISYGGGPGRHPIESFFAYDDGALRVGTVSTMSQRLLALYDASGALVQAVVPPGATSGRQLTYWCDDGADLAFVVSDAAQTFVAVCQTTFNAFNESIPTLVGLAPVLGGGGPLLDLSSEHMEEFGFEHIRVALLDDQLLVLNAGTNYVASVSRQTGKVTTNHTIEGILAPSIFRPLRNHKGVVLMGSYTGFFLLDTKGGKLKKRGGVARNTDIALSLFDGPMVVSERNDLVEVIFYRRERGNNNFVLSGIVGSGTHGFVDGPAKLSFSAPSICDIGYYGNAWPRPTVTVDPQNGHRMIVECCFAARGARQCAAFDLDEHQAMWSFSYYRPAGRNGNPHWVTDKALIVGGMTSFAAHDLHSGRVLKNTTAFEFDRASVTNRGEGIFCDDQQCATAQLQ